MSGTRPTTPRPISPTTSRAAAQTRPGQEGPGGPRVTGVVGVPAVDASVLDRTGLARVDYVDHFTLAPLTVTSPSPTAEQWARAMFGDVPSLGERFVWQALLQLRLAKGHSPLTVAGWRIAALGEDWVRLESESWSVRASLVVQTSGEAVTLTTAMQYERAFGARVWLPLSAVHRRLVPSLFRPAAEQLAPGPGQSRSGRSGPGGSGA